MTRASSSKHARTNPDDEREEEDLRGDVLGADRLLDLP